MFETPSFADAVPPGRYPVILSVAEMLSGDQRVACVLLRLGEHAVVRWEMAAPQGQILSELKPGEAFGYSVDFATGCFMDVDVPRELVAQEAARADVADESAQFYVRLDDVRDKTYVPTWSWADLVVDETTGANIIAFSSGWGDGFYLGVRRGRPACRARDLLRRAGRVLAGALASAMSAAIFTGQLLHRTWPEQLTFR